MGKEQGARSRAGNGCGVELPNVMSTQFQGKAVRETELRQWVVRQP